MNRPFVLTVNLDGEGFPSSFLTFIGSETSKFGERSLAWKEPSRSPPPPAAKRPNHKPLIVSTLYGIKENSLSVNPQALFSRTSRTGRSHNAPLPLRCGVTNADRGDLNDANQ
jgi:hypothetical protein